MKTLLNRRINQSMTNASRLHSSYDTAVNVVQETITLTDVIKRLNPNFVVRRENSVIVTEVGFVTMALIASHAVYREDLLLIPGVDERNQFGYLVLREGVLPYHSLANDVVSAAADAEAAHFKSVQLVEYFGGKAALKNAANQAPWYLLSTVEDAQAAGLCEWGTFSFLRRIGLGRISRTPILPRFMLRLAGGYGDRVTAASIRRLDTNAASNGQVTPRKRTGIAQNQNIQ